MNFDTLIISKEEKGISTPPVTTKKLCPFRKRTTFYQKHYYDLDVENLTTINLPRAEFMEEEFLPCVQSDCMFYNLYAPGGPACTKN